MSQIAAPIASLSPAAIAARIDRLPPSRPVWSWLAIVSFGAFFEIFETALTSLLAPLLVQAGIFHPGKSGLLGLPDLATFGFVTFIGLFVGAVSFSAIADRVGRRPIFTYSLVWYAVATLAMAVQSQALAICSWRFIAAIGVGAQIVAVDAYISELMPKAIRGRGLALSKAIQFLAVPVAAAAAAVLGGKSWGGIDGWRFVLVIPSIGAVLIGWVRRGLPESPRWLAERGRASEADAIVSAVEANVRAAIGRELPPVEAVIAEPTPAAGYLALFQGELRRRTLLLIFVSCAITVAFYGFNNWLPSLLQSRGIDVTKSLLYTGLIALSYPLVPYLCSFFADRLERKWQIVIGTGVVVVAGLAFAQQSSALGWLTCGFVLSIANNLAGYSSHTYRSELFPTAVRARGIGLVYSIDRLVAGFSSYLIGFLFLRGGVEGVLACVGACAVLASLVIAAFGPRTRGLASEAIRNHG